MPVTAGVVQAGGSAWPTVTGFQFGSDSHATQNGALHSVTALQFLPEPVRQLRVYTDSVENEGSGRAHVLSSATPASTEARRSTRIQPLPACPSSAHHQGPGILIPWHCHQRHVQACSAHEVPLSRANLSHQRSTSSRSCPGQQSDHLGKRAWCQSRPVWSKPAGLPGPR